MKKIKIISMDFDGTLLTVDKKVSNRTRKCLTNLKNKSYEQIEKQLKKIKNIVKLNDSYDYLLNMAMSSITKEHYLKLKEQLAQMKVKLNELKSIKAQDLWQSDLNKVSKYL